MKTLIKLFLAFGFGWMTLLTAAEAASIHVRGQFQCGYGTDGDYRLLNCQNAYLHGLNFDFNPHYDGFAFIEDSGHFDLQMELGNEPNVKNEMVFILRSRDEDRTLGIFYVTNNPESTELSESFFINQDQDFGKLKITKQREVFVPFTILK